MPDDTQRRGGFPTAIAAYGLWGTLPLYFSLMDDVHPVEIVGWRILFSVALCLPLVLLVPASRGAVSGLLRSARALAGLAAAGLFIAVNWLVYVYAVSTHQALDASLGYFLNPLVSVALAMLVLRERLRPLQWAAVGVAAAGLLVQLLAYGRLPWIALVLAVSFAVYGLVKKLAGARIDALAGFTVETTMLAPLGAACLAWTVFAGGGLGFGRAPVPTIALLFAGVATSLPLLLFARAAKRLTLVEIGIAQYIAPSLQFLIAVLLLHERMPPERWAGFVLVWAALALFTADLLRNAGRPAAGE
ncbi:MAG: EamA family transporter RarD [Pseudoclavibacter sp.]|nr:EamA family transporter RarD [Pseudoclavibacter sp.]